MFVVAVDLDDTICSRRQHRGGPEKYQTCYPLPGMVEKINDLYFNGNEIIIYTARGMSWYKGDVKACYDNLYDLTYKQLKDWGLSFHKLVMGKMHYDVLLDDKTVNPKLVDWENKVQEFLDECVD